MSKNNPSKSILDIPNYFLIPIVICIALTCAASSIFIFTRNSDYKDTGAIGDTIGGLTAPVFNLIASILVFISFKEQYKANQLQKDALEQEIKRTNSNNEYNQIIDLINEIKHGIDALYFYHVNGNEGYNGIDAIAHLDRSLFDDKQYSKVFWEDLVSSLNLIVFTINKINCYEYQKSEQQVLKIKFYNYLKKISGNINEYSLRLQNAQMASSNNHFDSFTSFENVITEFVKSTHEEVFNNPISK